ncbi:MAG: hypothetical protein LBJ10_03525 [Clostridiales bacterium]|jgi:hypothetical protein|nr:hypothetical protein [Clostridiales bacterium]
MPACKITKAKETMTARERVRRTFNYEKTDRVTIGYEANELIHRRLLAELGVGETELYPALGVDYCGLSPRYAGKPLFSEAPGLRTDETDGFRTRWIENQSGGGYWDFCCFPLQGADDRAIMEYPVANPDDFDYAGIAEQIGRYRDFALCIGHPGVADVINSMGRIMGMEDVLCNLQLGHEPTLALIRRRADSSLGVLDRILSKHVEDIDFMWLGEDLGTQIAPMVSLELYRRHIKPIHKMFIDLAKSYGIPAMMHTCGSSSWAYEDFIEMGVRGVDTLQPEAANMSPKYLKEHFGGRLAFRGCISTAGPLAYGTAEDTRAVCRETMEIMMEGGGYHFAPTHAIQDNSPVENVVAMYQAAHDFGAYA